MSRGHGRFQRHGLCVPIEEWSQARTALVSQQISGEESIARWYWPTRHLGWPSTLVISVFSLIYGIPPKEILEECRAKSIVTIAAATTSDEAASLQEAGVDAIAASGFEAGGHRGSFLQAAEGAEAVQM